MEKYLEKHFILNGLYESKYLFLNSLSGKEIFLFSKSSMPNLGDHVSFYPISIWDP